MWPVRRTQEISADVYTNVDTDDEHAKYIVFQKILEHNKYRPTLDTQTKESTIGLQLICNISGTSLWLDVSLIASIYKSKKQFLLYYSWRHITAQTG